VGSSSIAVCTSTALVMPGWPVRPFPCSLASLQGLTLAPFKAQIEDLRDSSLKSELDLSTFGTHPRDNLGHIGTK